MDAANQNGKSVLFQKRLGGSIPLQLSFLRYLFMILVLVNFLAVGCSQAPPPPKTEKKDPVVKYVYPVEDMVTDYEGFTRRLDALKTATLTARVTGYIDSAPFKEGDLVKEGDVLFTIDGRGQGQQRWLLKNFDDSFASISWREGTFLLLF